jgi:protein SCO1/2
MHGKKNHTMKTVFVLFGVIGLSLGLFLSQYMHRTSDASMSQFHGTWLEKPRKVGKFEFNGTDNALFNNDRLKNHWTMMFFGFTSCPSICPTTLAELGKMIRLLEDKGVKQLPEVVLVSLDPERDSVETLTQYVTAFNPHFYGARGANEEVVKAMASEMGVAYTKIALTNSTDEKNYNIEHTGTVMLLNPQGELTAFFTMPHNAQLLAEDYQWAIAKSGG